MIDGLEAAVADGRGRLGEADEPLGRHGRSDRLERRRPSRGGRPIGEKMSRPWKLEVTTGSIRSRFSSDADLDDAAEQLGGAGSSSPLSGPIRTSPRATRIAIGQPVRADARVDDRDVDADRHVRQREDAATRRRRGSSSAEPGG